MWNPSWNTIEPFDTLTPLCLYGREQVQRELLHDWPGNLHIWARAHIFLDRGEEAKKRILQITADDRYQLWLNGKYLGQGPAASYPDLYYYNSYELTKLLKPGDNVLAVHLFYSGLINRAENSGDGRFGLAAELSGEELSWRWKQCHAYSGNTFGYATQYQENFDSRKWENDWLQVDYPDDSWQPMKILSEKELKEKEWNYHFYPQPIQALEEEMVIPRKRLWNPTEEYIDILYDVGYEITGSLTLKAEGKDGQKILIRYGEELTEEGLSFEHIRWDMRCGCNYQEEWTLGRGLSQYIPWDYKGFRYVGIRIPADVKLIQEKLIFRHYPMKITSPYPKILSKSLLLDQIYRMCVHTIRCGTQEAYLDCPTREKGQYLGDVVVIAHSQTLLTGKTDMLRKAIDQFAFTLRFNPGMAAVAPGNLVQEIADYSLIFPELVRMDYRVTGDKDYLKKNLAYVYEILDYFKAYENENGLICNVGEKWNLVDWPENLRDDYDFTLTRPVVAEGCHNVINALYTGAKLRCCEIENMLGQEESFDKVKICKAFHNAFYSEALHGYVDHVNSSHKALHSSVFPLYFEIVPDELRKETAEFLLEKGICCGVYVAYFYLFALAQNGYKSEVLQLICDKWSTMLEEGGTTCFEAWSKQEKWNTSLCHPWAAAPIPILQEFFI